MDNKNRFEKGNQRARKHGFYSSVLDDAQQADFKHATTVEGLDEEIALLRVKIKSLIVRDPDNVRLITQAMNTLVKMIMIRYGVGKADTAGLGEKVRNVLKDVNFPFGFSKNHVVIGLKK